MKHPAGLLAFLPVLFLILAAPPIAAAQPVPAPGALTVSPQRVPIGVLYNGTALDLHITVPSGYQAAVRLIGRRNHLVLKKKAKRGGVLWMSAGEVTFENIPVVYQVLTSAPLSELGSPQLLAEMQLGYEWLVPPESPNASLREELVKLKEREGLFGISQGGLSRPGEKRRSPAHELPPSPAGGGSQTQFSGVVRLPALAPPGEYRVDLVVFSAGHASLLGSTTVRLERVGVVRMMYRLAMDHSLLYGCLAVVIAILAGLLCGLLFQSKSDEAH